MPMERSSIIRNRIKKKVFKMKCYIDALEGKDKDAVAICIVCGMALCMDHVRREDVTIWEGGYPFPSEKVTKSLPRILCPECYAALKGD